MVIAVYPHKSASGPISLNSRLIPGNSRSPKTVRLRTLNIKFKHTFMEIIKTSIDNVLILTHA